MHVPMLLQQDDNMESCHYTNTEDATFCVMGQTLTALIEVDRRVSFLLPVAFKEALQVRQHPAKEP
jgi:hypothetical protein